MQIQFVLWIWGHCHNDSIAIRRFLRWRGIVLAGCRFYGIGDRTKADRGHCESFLERVLINAQMRGLGSGDLVLDQSTTGFDPGLT